MIEHRCSIGERGGFFERLRRGTYLAHILEHVTLELQDPRRRRLRFWPGPRNVARRTVSRGGSLRGRAAGPRVPGNWPASCAWPRSTIGRSTSAAEIRQLAAAGRRRADGPQHARPWPTRPAPAAFRCAGSATAAWCNLGHGAKQHRISSLGHRSHRRRGRGDLRRQGSDQDVSCARPACRCPRAAGHERRRRLAGGPGNRHAGGRQAQGRQLRQRRRDRHFDARADRSRLSTSRRRLGIGRDGRATGASASSIGCWWSAESSSPPRAAIRP